MKLDKQRTDNISEHRKLLGNRKAGGYLTIGRGSKQVTGKRDTPVKVKHEGRNCQGRINMAVSKQLGVVISGGGWVSRRDSHNNV